MFNWFKKRLGYHVCEEFTQWERKTRNVTRPSVLEHDGVLALGHKTVTRTDLWQECRCTECGRIQQLPLEF